MAGERGAGRRVIWRGKRRCPACLAVVRTELREDAVPLEWAGTVHDAEWCEAMARHHWGRGIRWALAPKLWEWAA